MTELKPASFPGHFPCLRNLPSPRKSPGNEVGVKTKTIQYKSHGSYSASVPFRVAMTAHFAILAHLHNLTLLTHPLDNNEGFGCSSVYLLLTCFQFYQF